MSVGIVSGTEKKTKQKRNGLEKNHKLCIVMPDLKIPENYGFVII